MQFDNRQIIIKLKKRRYLSFIVYSVAMILLFFTEWFKRPVLGIDKSLFVISISVIYILYSIVTYILNYNFFSFSNDNDSYIFKFVSLRPFDSEKKTIILRKNSFRGIKIKESFFKLRKEIILFTETKNGVVSYPSISISALSKKNILLLKKILN